MPSNVIPPAKQDALGVKLAALYPQPNINASGYNYVSNPLDTRNRNQGDIRVDQVITSKDNAFYRFSMGASRLSCPDLSPVSLMVEASSTAWKRTTDIALPRVRRISSLPSGSTSFGWVTNRLRSARSQYFSNQDVASEIGFPGVPYVPGTDNGGLPQMYFSDASTLGSPTYLPSIEVQNTYTVSDTFTLISGTTAGSLAENGALRSSRSSSRRRRAGRSASTPSSPTTPERRALAEAAWPPSSPASRMAAASTI